MSHETVVEKLRQPEESSRVITYVREKYRTVPKVQGRRGCCGRSEQEDRRQSKHPKGTRDEIPDSSEEEGFVNADCSGWSAFISRHFIILLFI